MGAFFVLRNGVDLHPPEGALKRLRAHFGACGFAAPWQATTAHWHVAVYPKLNAADANVHAVDAANFAFATGTLIYRRKSGKDALRRIFDDTAAGRFDRDALRGAFALGVCRDNTLTLSIDPLGVYKAYRDEAWSTISSGFLATLESVPRPTADKQGVYEYVFQAATYGGRTIVDQVALVDHRQSIRLGATLDLLPLPERIDLEREPETFMQELDRSVSLLRDWFGELVGCFGDRIDTALSGGYDSRLILALLRDRGASPRVHVYGAPGDEDVRIARTIAHGENLALLEIDKADKAAPASSLKAIIERNCLLLDGYPSDGIIDTGADVATRADRAAGGALALNGGGGEIFRNFFYLPDRPFSLDEFIWTFYSQFDPASGTDAFSQTEYLDGLAEAVAHTLGHHAKTLSRRQIEYLYPGFRCRYWMGRNNSVNGRFGDALTPFIERHIVAEALPVPIAFKNHGRFEAALINAISPSLARYPSSYGYDFAGDVPFAGRMKNQLTLLRPPLLRRYAFRIKSRMQARACDVEDPTWRDVVDPAFPSMSRFFRAANMRDRAQFLRLCTLEYLSDRWSIAS